MGQALVPISSSLARSVADSILTGASETPAGKKIQLSIRIRSTNIVARDFATFLQLLDRVYGRSAREQFRSYARRETGHFAFSRSRQGSWELIAEHVIGAAVGSSPLLVIWLVLKYLPSTALSFSSAYNQLEQGRLARASRQQIRVKIKRDKDLSHLTASQRAEVARMIQNTANQEKATMPGVRRFMANSFLDVKLTIEKKSSGTPDEEDRK